MEAQLHASPGVLYGGSGTPGERRAARGAQPQFSGSGPRYGSTPRVAAPPSSTHLTVTPASAYPWTQEGQPPLQGANGNGEMPVPPAGLQFENHMKATPRRRTTGVPRCNVHEGVPRLINGHAAPVNMDWRKGTVGPAVAHGSYETPQAVAEASQWPASRPPADAYGGVSGPTSQFFRRRQHPPGPPSPPPPPPPSSGPVLKGFNDSGGSQGPHGGEAVLHACAAASGAVAQVLFTVLRGVYQSTTDVINSWSRPAWEQKLNYHPYSAQSYQIGDYEYEVMVYRKPRGFCAKMVRPS